ncbi:MAG: TRZ/ATZ family hydrolase [Gammaproteobacteria bacterium]|nr:MAG: TRZ/ATZ family hydrolase [Gammaproteobacteria bacterium]
MEQVDLLVTARWVVPVEPAGRILEDYAIAVSGGRILALLPAADARARYRAARCVERPRHVLLPGLVNAHTHAAMSLFRGLADDLPLEQWLQQHIWPAEARWASADFVRDGVALALLEMLGSGTTCFNDMYFFPEVTAQVAADHGLRATVGMILIEQPTAWASKVEEYFEKGLAVHDQFRGHPLIRTAFAPHAPYTVSDASLQHLRVLADELDVPVHMHLHETAAEVVAATADGGPRPLARLDALGLVNGQLIAVHMTQLLDAEIELLAERGASVVHCPESNLKLASGFCPVARLAAAGVNLALGTDGAASNNDLDLFGEMRSAALLGKAVAGDAAAVSAFSVLEMATLGGARALGLADEIGSLAPGKAADMICVDLDHPATTPVYHAVSQLVYAAGREQLSDAWVAGRALLEDGVPLLCDGAAIRARAAAWGRRIGAADD